MQLLSKYESLLDFFPESCTPENLMATKKRNRTRNKETTISTNFYKLSSAYNLASLTQTEDVIKMFLYFDISGCRCRLSEEKFLEHTKPAYQREN